MPEFWHTRFMAKKHVPICTQESQKPINLKTEFVMTKGVELKIRYLPEQEYSVMQGTLTRA